MSSASAKARFSFATWAHAVASRFHVTAQHGRCLEGWRAAREAVERALIACKYSARHPDFDPEVIRAVQDMHAWEELARQWPVLVEVES